MSDTGRKGGGWRRAAPLVALLGALCLLAAACSSPPSDGAAQPARSPAHPSRIIPGPAGLLSAGQPQPNGTMWVLGGPSSSRSLHEVDVSTSKNLGVVPVSSAAVSVAQSSTGVVAVGQATAATGAVELRNGSSGAALRTVAIGAPVRRVVPASDGITLYVLDATATSASVTMVDTQTGTLTGSLPVPLDTVAIAPTSGQEAVWVLQPDGQVSEVATAGGKVTTRFSVGRSGRDLAASPDGSHLYVLKGTGGVRNVAVVDVATERVTRALPAPASSVGVVVSADGGSLYDLVGTPTIGNIQVLPLSAQG